MVNDLNKKKINKQSTERIMNNKGFTLVEILAVIVIIGIIALIAIPSISKYLNSSKESTYTSYERSMEAAAKNRIIDCLTNNENCEMPEDEEAQRIYLDTLIEEGYLENMKDPETKKFCEQLISYVSIQGENAGTYKYKACLYCGDYYTDDDACMKRDGTEDGDKPVCGTVTGESTRWTNQNRTITIGCSDASSGCLQTVFSKTFASTTKFGIGKITIRDKSGNYTQCDVNAYVDKSKPTCNIKVEGTKVPGVGWYSMEATGKIEDMKDGELENDRETESGLLTFGMGTSIKTREYNKKESLTAKNGVTTIIGYVKDVAGNEGLCSEEVKVGTEQPKFNLYYGYTVYPNRDEFYDLDELSESGSNLTTSSMPNGNNTIILLKTIKYTNVERIKIKLKEAIPIDAPITMATLTVGGVTKSALMQPGDDEIVFALKSDAGTYDSYSIKLGDSPNRTYKIKKIELLTKDGSTWTDKDMTLYVEPDDAGLKTTEVSFAGGAPGSWSSTKYYKDIDGYLEGSIVTRNKIGMLSEETPYVARIDKSIPTVTVTAKKTVSEETVLNHSWSNEPLKFKLTPGVVGLSKQTLYYCVVNLSSGTDYCEPNIEAGVDQFITIPGTSNYNFIYKIVNEVGVDSGAISFEARFDTTKPVCEILDYASLDCTDSGEEGYISGVAGYYYNRVNSSSGQFASIPVNRHVHIVKPQLVTVEGTYYLYAKDLAGNISDVKSATYYRVTYDKNGGTTNPTKAYDIVREGQEADLSPTATKTGFAFAGWNTNPNAEIGLRSYQVNGSVTLYAIWLDLWASNIDYDDTSTGLGCSDVQCALDKISEKLH